MSKIVYSKQFVADASRVRQKSKRQEVRKRIGQLADFPDLGSRNLSDYIIEEYGENVRKLVVDPFLVIYEYDAGEDAVNILALLHQRSAW